MTKHISPVGMALAFVISISANAGLKPCEQYKGTRLCGSSQFQPSSQDLIIEVNGVIYAQQAPAGEAQTMPGKCYLLSQPLSNLGEVLCVNQKASARFELDTYVFNERGILEQNGAAAAVHNFGINGRAPGAFHDEYAIQPEKYPRDTKSEQTPGPTVLIQGSSEKNRQNPSGIETGSITYGTERVNYTVIPNLNFVDAEHMSYPTGE
jgi:hypothetical protein